jgi:hypothetical protein
MVCILLNQIVDFNITNDSHLCSSELSHRPSKTLYRHKVHHLNERVYIYFSSNLCYTWHVSQSRNLLTQKTNDTRTMRGPESSRAEKNVWSSCENWNSPDTIICVWLSKLTEKTMYVWLVDAMRSYYSMSMSETVKFTIACLVSENSGEEIMFLCCFMPNLARHLPTKWSEPTTFILTVYSGDYLRCSGYPGLLFLACRPDKWQGWHVSR